MSTNVHGGKMKWEGNHWFPPTLFDVMSSCMATLGTHAEGYHTLPQLFSSLPSASSHESKSSPCHFFPLATPAS